MIRIKHPLPEFGSNVQLLWSWWVCSEKKELELLPQDYVLKKRISQVTNLRMPPLRTVCQILHLVGCLREQLHFPVWIHMVEVQLLVCLPLWKDAAHGSKSVSASTSPAIPSPDLVPRFGIILCWQSACEFLPYIVCGVWHCYILIWDQEEQVKWSEHGNNCLLLLH